MSNQRPQKPTSFFKSLSRSIRKNFGPAPETRKQHQVVPTAIGGSEQPMLLAQLKNANNHTKLLTVLQLRQKIEEKSISSILETWLPARKILADLEADSDSYSKYEKLRHAVIELLYSCIVNDDLSQISILTRYVCDILYFCRVDEHDIDPSIAVFLKCLHAVMMQMAGDIHVDMGKSRVFDPLRPQQPISDLSCSKSVTQFIVEVLKCDAMCSTEAHRQTLCEFIQGLAQTLRTENSPFFTTNSVNLMLHAMFKITMSLPRTAESKMVVESVLAFINTALGCYHIPYSVLDQVMAIICYFYTVDEYFSVTIEDLFCSLMSSDNCSYAAYATLISFIQPYDFSHLLSFSSLQECQDSEVLSYKDSFVKSVAQLTHDELTVSRSRSSDKTQARASAVDKYFPMLSKPAFADSKDPLVVVSSVELSNDILLGCLSLLLHYIMDRNGEVVNSLSFIFEPSSFRFQSLINSLHVRLRSVCDNESDTDYSQRLINTEIVLQFFDFIIRNLKVFKNIPDELFFYGLNCDDDGSVDSHTLVSSNKAVDEKCYSILDVLDLIFDIVFDKDVFKLSVESFKLNSASFVNSLNFYHAILSVIYKYSQDYEYRMKLEPGDLHEFYFKKLNMLTYNNWKGLMTSFQNHLQISYEDSPYMKNLMFIVSCVFSPDGETFCYFNDKNSSSEDVKVLVLDTVSKIISDCFFYYGNNERLWPLVVSLFGFDTSQGCFLKSQSSKSIRKNQLDSLRIFLASSKILYFKQLLSGVLKGVDSLDFENPNKTYPLESLIGVVKIMVSLFIKSAINPNYNSIKDGAEKCLYLYHELVKLLDLCVRNFQCHSHDEAYIITEDGQAFFKLLYVLMDCLTRIRSNEEGFIYFSNIQREYKILSGKPARLLKSKEQETTYLERMVVEILDNNRSQLLLPEKCLNRVSDTISRGPEISAHLINVNEYLDSLIKGLDGSCGIPVLVFIWYSIVLQMANMPLFSQSIDRIKTVRSLACSQIAQKQILEKPVDRSDMIVLSKILIRLSVRLIMFSQYYSKEEKEDIINVLIESLNYFDTLGIICIHTLTVCCYQMSSSIQKFMHRIIWKLETHISNSDATPHVLEFLLSVSHLPKLITSFSMEDHKRIFAIAFRFIQSSRDIKVTKETEQLNVAGKEKTLINARLPSYLSALSYNVISGWFLKIKMSTRRQLASYLIESLLKFSAKQDHTVDSTCMILIDFIQRFTYTNLDLRFQLIKEKINKDDNKLHLSRWVFGISIISVLTNKSTGNSVITVRRPTGTTKFEVKPHPAMVPLQNLAEYADSNEALFTESYVFLQLLAHIFTNIQKTPLLIPDKPEFTRKIELFDKKPLIKVYKAGLIYIAPGQSKEQEILLNTVGSKEYQRFISNIGDLIDLSNNTTYYKAGLVAERDGQYAYCWDDKVTQMLFHTTTMMPSDREDSWVIKKSHVGNDYVNIFFDESGKKFDFNLIKSQFTFANIVINPVSLQSEYYNAPFGFAEDGDTEGGDTEEDEKFYLVKTYLRADVPQLFATCRLKTIGSSQLPIFVRNIAMIAFQFAQIWESNGDNIEINWSDRYQEILNIRDKVKDYYKEQNNGGGTSGSKQQSTTISLLSGFNQQEPSEKETETRKLFDLLNFTNYS